MHGIVQELLRLECAKENALIQGDAAAYDESVRAQLLALNSSSSPSSLEAEARGNPETLRQLGKIVRRNTALFWNLMSVSPAFALSSGYNSEGHIETRDGRRIQVEG